MAQYLTEENLEIVQTDVMTGDKDYARFLYYQLKMSIKQAKQMCKAAFKRFGSSLKAWRKDSTAHWKLSWNYTAICFISFEERVT